MYSNILFSYLTLRTVAVLYIGTVSNTDATAIRKDMNIADPEPKAARSGCMMQRYRSTAKRKLVGMLEYHLIFL